MDLAQVNIARLAAEIDSPQLADFVAALDSVNELAESSPGFVWRLQSPAGNATDIVAFTADIGDAVGVITNLSTWRDVESLAAFVYQTMHAEIMRRRREWFLPFIEAYTVCWWVPAGHEPTVAEAEERLTTLRAHGPTPDAFTIKRAFADPSLTAPGEQAREPNASGGQ